MSMTGLHLRDRAKRWYRKLKKKSQDAKEARRKKKEAKAIAKSASANFDTDVRRRSSIVYVVVLSLFSLSLSLCLSLCLSVCLSPSLLFSRSLSLVNDEGRQWAGRGEAVGGERKRETDWLNVVT